MGLSRMAAFQCLAHRGVVACGAAALLLVVVGPALAHFRLVAPHRGLFVMLLALPLALVGAVWAVLIEVKRAGHVAVEGEQLGVWLGLLSSLAVLGIIVGPQFSKRGLPAINDISTDVEDPPTFVAIAALPVNRGSQWLYPDEFREKQRAAYPQVQSLLFVEPPDRVFKAVEQAVRELGFSTVARAPSEGRLEASDETRLFRFVDDLAVRVRVRDGGGTVVDVRSKSRDGKGDLGANARRILVFSELIGKLVALPRGH